MKYYTHAGLFHADEVLGYAIVCEAMLSTSLHRLTDISVLPEDGIIADIGREYDPERLRFDHHQGFLTRDNGYPYATAGLLWKKLGTNVVWSFVPDISESHADAIADRVDKVFIQGVDAHDADSAYDLTAKCSAGEVSVMSFSSIIGLFNDDDVQDHDFQERMFNQAARFTRDLLGNIILNAAKFIESQKEFDSVAEVGAQVIVLSKGLPWKEIVHERYPDAVFVIAPSAHPGSPWSLISVPVHPAKREIKCAIERPDWFDGFIHQGKWIAGGKSVEELNRLAEFNLSNGLV